MSDRKYRQRGYMDDERDRKPERPKTPGGGPAGPRPERPEGPRTPNLMAAREVVRCSRCGAEIAGPYAAVTCGKCGSDVHACAQCVYFDPGARFQCMQAIPERIAKKDERNTCTLWEPRKTIERATHSVPTSSARQAFDDLFK
jgi:hypothetical protein